MTMSRKDETRGEGGGPGAGDPSHGAPAPTGPGMTRNQKVAWGIVSLTLGLAVGAWMALALFGLSATDGSTEGTDTLSGDLSRVQEDVDALARTLDDAQGEMAANEASLVSTLRLVEEVKAQMEALDSDVDGIMLLVDGQEGDLEDLGAQLDETRTDLEATRERLLEALLELEYAKGRIDGTQPSANMTFDELATVLADLSIAISSMQATQDALSDAIVDMLAALGGGPPDGMALYKPHLAHFESSLLDFRCSMCHNVDLEGGLTPYDGQLYFNGSLASEDFRVQIDERRVCSDCHDWFPLGEMDPGDKERSCTIGRCHDDWREEMSSPFVHEDLVTVDDCLLCHGGQPFYPR